MRIFYQVAFVLLSVNRYLVNENWWLRLIRTFLRPVKTSGTEARQRNISINTTIFEETFRVFEATSKLKFIFRETQGTVPPVVELFLPWFLALP